MSINIKVHLVLARETLK